MVAAAHFSQPKKLLLALVDFSNWLDYKIVHGSRTMKILVCIKQVPDTETKITITPDNNGIDETGIKWIINPYDEFALEEALKIKDNILDGLTVTVMSLGPKKRVTESLRTALAMGADDAIVIDCSSNLDANATATALAAATRQEGNFDVIFTGTLAIDDNAASVSQMLAQKLGLPHTTSVIQCEAQGDHFALEREIEGGAKEVVQLSRPAVIGAHKGLNQPRYASLPGIMRAKKKPLKEVDFASLNIPDETQKTRHSHFERPAEKPPVQMIEGDPAQQAKELAQRLREEARAL